jgi:flavin-dependent dehydrogenase
MKEKKVVKILGAGASGLSAAINLAKAGYKVEVFERGKDAGFRFHGDVEGLENWSMEEDFLESLKKMNIKPNFDHDPFHGVKISNGKKVWNIKTKRPAFYLIKRGPVKGSVDEGLKRQALKLGVKIYFNKTIPEREADIIATGPSSKRIFGIDRGIVFKTTHKNLALGLLNEKYAYHGYSYLLITKGYGCIATCVEGDFTHINKYFEDSEKILERLAHIREEKPKACGGIGNFSLNGPYKKDNRLYVGEAAGIQDFMWGFGIRNALTSGYLAAKSIIENEDYEKIARAFFKNRLKASVVNRYLWIKNGERDYTWLLNKLERQKDVLKLLRSFYNFNLLQRILYPIALNYCRKEYPNLNL